MKPLNKNGLWGLILEKGEELNCCVCKERIAIQEIFFYCDAYKKPFHDFCKDKITCSKTLDLHEDFIIKFVEVQ